MRYFLIFLFIAGFLFTGCKDDEPDIPQILSSILNYDGDNLSAPLLDAGLHEAGIRFTTNDLDGYEGRFVEHIDFYLYDLPDVCEVRVYEGTSNVSPVRLIYNFDVTDSLSRESWNRHTLNPPVEILNDDLWFVILMDADTDRNMIGCDRGPAEFNGDWLWTEFDNSWFSFVSRTQGNVDINWNIRALLNE